MQNGQCVSLQILPDDCLSFTPQYRMQHPGEPLFQNANAAKTPLVKKLPFSGEIRLVGQRYVAGE